MSESRETLPVLFKEHTADGLHEHLSALGVDLRLARRLQGVVLQRGHEEVPATLPEVSPRLLDRVRQATHIPRLELLEKRISPRDGFTKYLFRGEGAHPAAASAGR